MSNQLRLSFGGGGDTGFSREWMQDAQEQLQNLSNPYQPWPEHVSPVWRHRWQQLAEHYKDTDHLARAIAHRALRGRIPFGNRPIIDHGTSEIIGERALSVMLHDDVKFREFRMPAGYSVVKGKPTKPRAIHAPTPRTELIHREFLMWANQTGAYPLDEHAYGMQTDRSYLDAAIAHAGNRYFLTMDIAQAYQQVQPQRLSVELANTDATRMGPLGFYPLVLMYFMPEGATRGLATGGNASPLLFNIYMRRFDSALAAYAQSYGMTYTRYMDDITLSAPDTGKSDFDRINRGKAKFAKTAMAAMGFVVNDHKVRYKDVMHDGPVMLPGTQVNADGSWQIPECSARNMERIFTELEHELEANGNLDPWRAGLLHGLNSYIEHFISRRAVHGLGMHATEGFLKRRYREIDNRLP